MRQLDPSALGDHLDRLYRAAWGLCGSREDAEDLVQQTYARVLARPRMLQEEHDLGYLLRTLRNTYLDSVAAARRRPQTMPLPEDDAQLAEIVPIGNPEDQAVDAELLDRLATLHQPYREVLVAVDLLGLSYPQAARALRIRIGTVRSRLHRARAAFLGLLEAAEAA